MGGLPLHSLCKNTISDEETLMIMFWTLIDAHEDAIFVQNSMEFYPINLLEQRLNMDYSRRTG